MEPASRFIDMKRQNITIVGHDRCFACQGCGQICPKGCISFKEDEEGFLYPLIEGDCIHCGLCVDVCPAENRILNKSFKVFAAKNSDKDIQYASSSGGVFTSLAKPFLQGEGRVYGAVYTPGFEGVTHAAIKEMKSLIFLRGSKYVQSDMAGVYRRVKSDLKDQKKVLFSGTPCQVMGLKNFLGNDYVGLVTVDLLCYGIPSPKLFREYIAFIKSMYGEVADINMKDKKRGWNKQIPKIMIEDGKELPTRYEVLWLKIYFSRLALRCSCYSCPFTRQTRCGDITIGDYWGIEKVNPDFYSRDGVSLIMVNTEKGEALLNEICNDLCLYKSEIADCMQQALEYPMSPPEERADFWKKYFTGGFAYICQDFWQIQ